MTIHIHFKLYASLADYLPPDANGNQVDLQFPDDVTPYRDHRPVQGPAAGCPSDDLA
ncbi:MAG: hypothetical protein U5P41_13230 [Gammaproteobacteria bacterium]|nr:hypothetical protein [Gammaproteobacteria bacterium]